MQTIHAKRVLFRGLPRRRVRQIVEPAAAAGAVDSNVCVRKDGQCGWWSNGLQSRDACMVIIKGHRRLWYSTARARVKLNLVAKDPSAGLQLLILPVAAMRGRERESEKKHNVYCCDRYQITVGRPNDKNDHHPTQGMLCAHCGLAIIMAAALALIAAWARLQVHHTAAAITRTLYAG